MLKRLADAERDGDRIYAVIKGVGGVAATAAASGSPRRARRASGGPCDRAYAPGRASRPPTVGLVEAHGTGTVVGDRTELATLTEVFAERGAEPGRVRRSAR